MTDCKSRSQNVCVDNNCLYANGSQRKYCRRRSRVCKGRTFKFCKKKCKVAKGTLRKFCRKKFNTKRI